MIVWMIDFALTVLLVLLVLTGVVFVIGLIIAKMDNTFNKRYITKEIHSNERID